MSNTYYEEHPFAQYVRILGKGKNGSRSLTQQEAYDSLSMILRNEVSPEQLGAFLMLLRFKEEGPEELAGFVRAVKEHLDIPANAPEIQVDWSSYAGKRRYLPWFILSTLLLAENGIRVFMHGASGHTNGRIYTKEILPALGIEPCTSMEQVCRDIEQSNFAYMDIEHLSPRLHEIIELRPLMGLRSPVHTLARLINPFDAPYVMQGIFHPGYRPVHQETAILLKQPHMAVIKGDGGEIERNPDMECLVQSVANDAMFDETWPAMYPKRHVKDDELDVSRLAKLWRGETEDEYGLGAVIGTLAIALKTLGKADTPEDAEALARQWWQQRRKDKFGAAA